MVSSKIHQPILDGMPEYAAPIYDPARHKMSVARLLRPETHGFDEAEMMTEQTPAALSAVWPDKLYPYLVGPAVLVSMEGQGSQAVRLRENGAVYGVALSARERLDYGYSYEGLINRAINGAKDAKDGKYATGDEASPQRAALHAVESKIEVLSNRLDILHGQQIILQKFTEALHFPNLSRMGNEQTMRSNFAIVSDEIIKGMLEALRDQKGWSLEQNELAKNAIFARLLADRAENRHLKYASKLFTMLLSYGNFKAVALRRKKSRGEAKAQLLNPKTVIT